MVGLVVSTKLKNTVTVLVSRVAKHPLYKKNYTQSKKYLVEAKIEVKVGDIVEFENCRPISKRIASRVTKVLGKDFAEIAEAQLKKDAATVISEVMPEPVLAKVTEDEEKKIVADKPTDKPKSKKKGKTDSSKK